MTFSRRALIATTFLVLATATTGANAASVDRQFSDAVAKILSTVHNSFLDGLSAKERRTFVACAQNIMGNAPLGRKQYVLASKNQGEMRKRFDEVALDNHAVLKQRIAKECAN